MVCVFCERRIERGGVQVLGSWMHEGCEREFRGEMAGPPVTRVALERSVQYSEYVSVPVLRGEVRDAWPL